MEEAEEERIELQRGEGGRISARKMRHHSGTREAGFKLYRNSGACMLSGFGSFMETNSMKLVFGFHK